VTCVHISLHALPIPLLPHASGPEPGLEIHANRAFIKLETKKGSKR
jgi:hypothetical protein